VASVRESDLLIGCESMITRWKIILILTAAMQFALPARGEDIPITAVDGQPLGANIKRVLAALEYLGAPLSATTSGGLIDAARRRDAVALQKQLDPHVLLTVSLNPESRVKVRRGPATARLQQAGFVPILVKVINDSTVTKQLRIHSPQAGPVYAGVSPLSMRRQQQEALRINENPRRDDRFLAVRMFTSAPMKENLSGLEVEYAIGLIYSSESGRREATIGFDVGQGTEDLGFRGETSILFDVRPAIPVRLSIKDHDGRPTTARLRIQDAAGRIYPPQAQRLAPDFFFQPHIYRVDGEIVKLPPGKLNLQFGRGPEYRVLSRQIVVPSKGRSSVALQLERWVDPLKFGFYSGDHHIHAAGCAHYTSPTEGVTPEDMYRQVKGEGLNVGCILTWGPCFDHQRQFFHAAVHQISERHTLLKYDLEIGGFGSAALGHVCLLNLSDQTYPSSQGTSTKGWPTWTTPVMRWAKKQGGVTGYAHSASGLQINPTAAASRLLKKGDTDGDGQLDVEEAARQLLPISFTTIDTDRSGSLDERELAASIDWAAEQLPNLAIPEMNGVGAMEICVAVSEGVCDFISAMDTARIQEWNTWYHVMNCGFSLKVSGETDFPCMSSRRVGQGRVYVNLPKDQPLEFGAWCEGLAAGRSYVSDGYAHALEFQVNDVRPGTMDVELAAPGKVTLKTLVTFAAAQPNTVAQGSVVPATGKRHVGDTVVLHADRTDALQRGGSRKIEIVVNGAVVASQEVPADGSVHDLTFEVSIDRSSWVAVRHFPQLHTNPVNVIVGGEPIRASRRSAQWCRETIELLWKNREHRISVAERDEAARTFERAIERYRVIAAECPEGS
jgi:hypothetical protein